MLYQHSPTAATHVQFPPRCCFIQGFLSYRYGKCCSTCFRQAERRKKNQQKTGKNWFGVYLVGFTRELAATKLALDLSLGAVVLQVVGQVAARQLDRAAVGAGYYVESAGGEVALGGGGGTMTESD